MTKLNNLFFLVILTFFSVSSLSHQLTTMTSTCVCDSKHHDPLEEPQEFSFGRFSGQCIDSCHFRRGHILSKLSSFPNLKLGNILNDGVFYSGNLNVKEFEKIEMGFEEFLPGISHVFLKFQISPNSSPIRLYDQRSSSELSIQTRGIVLSAEAVPPKGHKYQIFESYFENYLIATRVVTAEEMERWSKELKHPVKLYSLTISPKQISQIFLNGVQDSDSNSLKAIYKLFTDNCSTRALKYIDSEIGYKPSQNIFNWKEFEEALPLAGPIGTLRALKLRNLVKY